VAFNPFLLQHAIDPESVEACLLDVSKVSEVQAVLRVMSPEEQGAALSRARTLTEYGKIVEEAVGAARR
jgi:hypothetical protein